MEPQNQTVRTSFHSVELMTIKTGESLYEVAVRKMRNVVKAGLQCTVKYDRYALTINFYNFESDEYLGTAIVKYSCEHMEIDLFNVERAAPVR